MPSSAKINSVFFRRGRGLGCGNRSTSKSKSTSKLNIVYFGDRVCGSAGHGIRLFLYRERAASCEEEGQKVRLRLFREFVLPASDKPFIDPAPIQEPAPKPREFLGGVVTLSQGKPILSVMQITMSAVLPPRHRPALSREQGILMHEEGGAHRHLGCAISIQSPSNRVSLFPLWQYTNGPFRLCRSAAALKCVKWDHHAALSIGRSIRAGGRWKT